MSQVLSVSEATLKGFNLSITVRDNGESPTILEELTYRTIGAWLWIASRLEQNVYTIPDELGGTVESRYAAELSKSTDTDAPPKPPFEFAQTFGDSRVTIWDGYRGAKRINFHLNSDDDLQCAVDTWCAAQNAIDRAYEKWGDKMANITPDTQPATAPQGNAMFTHEPQERPATPKSTNTPPAPPAPQNKEEYPKGPLMTKKDAIAKLQSGNTFQMKIVQIKRRSKDGQDYYEFYEPYGGKPGEFAAVSVFVDNEVAVNNGLIDYLSRFNIGLGQAHTGEWMLNCSVGKPKTKTVKGEEKTFTNIYVNSFEGQS